MSKHSRRDFAVLVLFALILVGFTSRDVNASEHTILDLRQQGWQVIDINTRTDRAPGKAPYAHIKRDIRVNTFTLSKGAKQVSCIAQYDSQSEKYSEDCRMAQAGVTIMDLRNQGWKVTDMVVRKKQLKGIEPYENAMRDIRLTTFELELMGKKRSCQAMYDSQSEKYNENCWSAN